jgi:threonylcarbamoyladenosine tRNA methylthiotransferase MtaB
MKIYLDSIGCRLNQSEIENYGRQFRSLGHELVATPEEADLAVVNTCTVTNAAASDSRQKIRQANHAGLQEIIVTGCWSTLDPESASSMPGVSKIIPNADKDHLVSNLLQVPQETFDLEPLARQPLPGPRLRTRVFIKVQDGCDNRCTFCVTTLARGPGKSRSVSDILSDIHAALHGETADNGAAKEIVLTGVHMGSWGRDFYPALRLSHLVKTILKETDVPRVRLSSIEPWNLDPDFFPLLEHPRLCHHLHLPLQSGSAAILKRMARKITPESYFALVTAIRSSYPEIAITTDLIAGFPGESEREFSDTLEFVRKIGFAGGHVFTYSPRPGTAAAYMADQVPYPQRKERNAELRALLSESAQVYQQRFLGRTLPVLWENVTAMGSESWHLSGLTGNYLRVKAQAPRYLWNKITPVHLTGIRNGSILGEVLDPWV